MSNLAPLAEYNKNLESLVRQLSPAACKQLANEMGKAIRKRNQDRIKAQRNPDNSSFTPRKKVVPEGVSFVKKNTTFTYKGHNQRMLTIRDLGTHVVGYDELSGGVRKFSKEFIKAPDGENWGSYGKTKPTRRQMFSKIRLARFLKVAATSSKVDIYFAGEIGIAARHHLGVDTPSRQLLGINGEDRELLRTMLIEHLGKSL